MENKNINTNETKNNVLNENEDLLKDGFIKYPLEISMDEIKTKTGEKILNPRFSLKLINKAKNVILIEKVLHSNNEKESALIDSFNYFMNGIFENKKTGGLIGNYNCNCKFMYNINSFGNPSYFVIVNFKGIKLFFGVVGFRNKVISDSLINEDKSKDFGINWILYEKGISEDDLIDIE